MKRLSVMTHRALLVPLDVVWGAAFFWIPDIVVHAIVPRYAPLIGLVLFSWVLPLVTVVGLEAMWRRRSEVANRALIALAMIFGIWFFGPLCAALDLNLSGGTFDAKSVVVLTAIAPLSMIDLATYDGTLFALPLATLILLLSVSKEWHLPGWFPVIQR